MGVRVHGDKVVEVEVSLDDNFRMVPIPSLLDVPLMCKRMPGTGGDDSKIRNNIIVRFMSDPDDGFAPPEWQYGGAQRGPAPPVALARKDGIPFSKQEWEVVGEYLEVWSEECGEAEEGRLQVSERILQPEAFRTFVMGQRDVRPSAFLSLQFPVGCTVVAEGLTTAELNGKEGEVVQYSRDRVGIQFPERAVTALKPERLRLVREAPQVEQATKRQDTGEEKVARKRHVEKMEARVIAKRFVECLNEDTFPEFGDIHLFGVGSDYHARSQDVLAVWQGAVKHMGMGFEVIADALEAGTMKEFFEKTCEELAATRTPNSTYANVLIKNKYAAMEWDTL